MRIKVKLFLVCAFLALLLVVFLVNFKRNLELVDLSERACWLNTKQQVDIKAKYAVEKLIIDAEKNGMCLVVSSGYRTFEEQERIKEKYGELAEEPGKSEHHTGLAVDFVGCPMTDGKRDDSAKRLELEKPFDELPEYEWLKRKASDYGFEQSYQDEPWHWKLVSRKEAYEVISPFAERPVPTPTVPAEPEPTYHYGKASWYGSEFCSGRPCRTASGEWFDENAFTCACSDDFPLGTRFIVSYNENSVEVRCNDRGAFKKKYGRILDLSKKAFETLAPNSKGVIWVRIKEVK
jgi:rare lipoprotein A